MYTFSSLHFCWYFHTILQTRRLRFRTPQVVWWRDWLSQPGCPTPAQFSDHLLMARSQQLPPKGLSEAIDAFIYLFLQQIFIEGLLCARFGAWRSFLLLLHWRAEHHGMKSQSERRSPHTAFSSCAMSLLVIKCLSLPWHTFFMPQSIVILQTSLFWQCKHI